MSYPTLTEIKHQKVARMEAAVEALAGDLAAYARERGGRFVLFGSAARGELRHDSDVDILTDFPPEDGADAWDFAEARAFALGLRPDVSQRSWSGPHLLERVEQEGRLLDGSPISGAPRPSRKEHPAMDARWADIRRDCETVAGHFRAGARVFREGGLADREGLDRVMALLHYMQSGHSSLEACLLRVLAILDETPPTGSDWHAQLIIRCATAIAGSRSAILSADLAADAQETRRFRHLAMHGYDVAFVPERGARAIEAGLRLADALPARLDSFAREIDP